MPTASGKSFVIAAFIQQVLEQFPGERILILTHVRELIQQNYIELLNIWEKAPVGVYSAGFHRRDTSHSIIFAGIQSVHRRARILGRFDLVLIDECHLVPYNSNTMYRRFLSDMSIINPQLKVLGFTATHYRLGSGLLTEGDERIFTHVAYELPLRRLIDEKFLAPLISKRSATRYDLSHVKIKGGEYDPKSLERAVDKNDLTVLAKILVNILY